MRSARFSSIICGLALAVCVDAGVYAQSATPPAPAVQPPKAPPPVETFTTRIYRLTKGDPNNVGKVLSSTIAGVRTATDPLSRLLVVTGTPDSQLQAAELIKQLDVDPFDEGSQKTDDIHLIPVDFLDDAIERTIELAVDGKGEVAFDRARDLAVLKASPAVLDTVSRLVEELRSINRQQQDEQMALRREEVKPNTGRRLRLVWLIGQQDGTPTTQPDIDLLPPSPGDLNPVLKELGSFGVVGLGLAAQVLVSTSDGKFDIVAGPALPLSGDGGLVACTMNVQGQIVPDANSNRVSLIINVTGTTSGRLPAPGSSSTLCTLNTVVDTPLDHAVVIGAAPIGNLTSVFVLQVLPAN